MATSDRFGDTGRVLDAPASKAFAVTPSDSTSFADYTRGIYVGGTGDVTVVMLEGGTITFSAVPAGAILPIRCSRVNSTSTTATLMIGLL